MIRINLTPDQVRESASGSVDLSAEQVKSAFGRLRASAGAGRPAREKCACGCGYTQAKGLLRHPKRAKEAMGWK